MRRTITLLLAGLLLLPLAPPSFAGSSRYSKSKSSRSRKSSSKKSRTSGYMVNIKTRKVSPGPRGQVIREPHNVPDNNKRLRSLKANMRPGMRDLRGTYRSKDSYAPRTHRSRSRYAPERSKRSTNRIDPRLVHKYAPHLFDGRPARVQKGFSTEPGMQQELETPEQRLKRKKRLERLRAIIQEPESASIPLPETSARKQ